jgi:flagellar hook protein FlgE
MGILSSLFAAVSGLNSTGSSISIIGDNIANSNTTGFKASRPEFVDVLSGNLGGTGGAGQVGAGSRLAGVSQTFNQGPFESTDVTTDLAVDGGGFFIVSDTTGQFYTRAGVFRLDANQILVNPAGQTVQGFGISPSGSPNGALQPIDLSTVSSTPQATDTVEVNVNLDPNLGVPPAFDQADPVNTSTFQTGIRIFDSLGNPRNILVYMRKAGTLAADVPVAGLPARSVWEYFSGAAASDLDPSVVPAAAAPEDFVAQDWGLLEFDAFGSLTRSIPDDLFTDGNADGAADVFDYDGAGGGVPPNFNFNNGAAPNQVVTFDFGGPLFTVAGVPTTNTGVDKTTQFGGQAASGVNSFVRFMNQNGFSAGSLQNVEIDEDGFVTGLFSNGVTQRLAQVALGNFPNIRGLKRIGDNNFIETNASGNPVIGSPNQSGFGAIRSGFLELSNVDLAGEFVKLILAQRAFQANTRTVSTTNELLANLVFLGQ